MTENEAIEVLKQPCYCDYDLSATIENCEVSSCDRKDAMRMAIQALEEVQQYRAIGTVEEFKAFKLGRLGNKGFITIGQTMEEYAQKIRENAIDEFAEKFIYKAVCEGCSGCCNCYENEAQNICEDWKYYMAIAEQLKGGAE